MSVLGLGASEEGWRVLAPWIGAEVAFASLMEPKATKERRKAILAEAQRVGAETEQIRAASQAAQGVMLAQQMAEESARAAAYRQRLEIEGRQQRLRDAQEGLEGEVARLEAVVQGANGIVEGYSGRLASVAEIASRHMAAIEDARYAASDAMQEASYVDPSDLFGAEMAVRTSTLRVRDHRARAEDAVGRLAALLGATRGGSGLLGLGLDAAGLLPVAAVGLALWSLWR